MNQDNFEIPKPAMENQEILTNFLCQNFLNQYGRINVQALWIAKGLNQRKVAQKHAIQTSELNRVLKGKLKNPNIRRIIAEELGVSSEFLWGNRGLSY